MSQALRSISIEKKTLSDWKRILLKNYSNLQPPFTNKPEPIKKCVRRKMTKLNRYSISPIKTTVFVKIAKRKLVVALDKTNLTALRDVDVKKSMIC